MNSDPVRAKVLHTYEILLPVKYRAWGSGVWAVMGTPSVWMMLETPRHPRDCHWEMS